MKEQHTALCNYTGACHFIRVWNCPLKCSIALILEFYAIILTHTGVDMKQHQLDAEPQCCLQCYANKQNPKGISLRVFYKYHASGGGCGDLQGDNQKSWMCNKCNHDATSHTLRVGLKTTLPRREHTTNSYEALHLAWVRVVTLPHANKNRPATQPGNS